MSNERTTLNVAKTEHQATREVKDEHNESWTDVLRFYREHRPTVAVGETPDTDALVEELKNDLSMASDPTVEVDVPELYEQIDRLKELVEATPERTADEFERKYR